MVALVHHCLLSQYLPCGSGSTLSFKSDARILFLQLYETHRDWIAERYQNVLRQFIEHESQSGTSHSNVTILVIAIAMVLFLFVTIFEIFLPCRFSNMIYNLQLVTSRPTSVKGQTAVNSEFVFLISNVNLGIKTGTRHKAFICICTRANITSKFKQDL